MNGRPLRYTRQNHVFVSAPNTYRGQTCPAVGFRQLPDAGERGTGAGGLLVPGPAVLIVLL